MLAVIILIAVLVAALDKRGIRPAEVRDWMGVEPAVAPRPTLIEAIEYGLKVAGKTAPDTVVLEYLRYKGQGYSIWNDYGPIVVSPDDWAEHEAQDIAANGKHWDAAGYGDPIRFLVGDSYEWRELVAKIHCDRLSGEDWQLFTELLSFLFGRSCAWAKAQAEKLLDRQEAGLIS